MLPPRKVCICQTALFITLLTALLMLPACSKKRAAPPAAPARVSATSTFVSYFGPAPTTDKGTCYAFVIFFPSALQPGKVVPFPFFSFDESTVKKVALERQLAGMDVKPYAGQFRQLFPQGTRLLSLSEQGGSVTANYSRELGSVTGNAAGAAALYNAVALTLAQFPGVAAVRIQSDGRDLFPQGQALPGKDAVLQPGPPRLLDVVAMRETAVAPIGEVDVMFDRPVEIREFQLSSEDGTPLAGDVFLSVFDMAAVLKPKEPGKLAQVGRVKVRWNVVDKVGRSGAGEAVLPLEVRVHQD